MTLEGVVSVLVILAVVGLLNLAYVLSQSRVGRDG